MPTSEIRVSPLLRQLTAASGSILTTVAAGLTFGYSAVLLPQLHHSGSEIQSTTDDDSWIASMAPLPMAVGCIFGGLLMEKIGRRSTLILLNVPFILGWICIAMASNLPLILVGRFLCGFCVGLLGPSGIVYIAETSQPTYRGFFLAAVSLAIAVGILVSHILGTFFHWKLVAVISAFVPACSIFVLFVCPESPSWLVMQGKLEQASNAFYWLRANNDDNNRELQNIVSGQCHSDEKRSWTELKCSILNRKFIKPLVIITLFFFTMQFAGVNTLIFYSVTIMKSSVGDFADEYTSMIVVDAVRVVMSVVACVVVKTSKRRPLAIVSSMGTAFALFGLFLYLHLSVDYPFLKNYSWVSLLLIISYICFVSIGLMPLPWCMGAELFPLALRGLGSGVVSCMNFIFFFVVVKSGPFLFESIGQSGTFLVYAVVAMFGTIFVSFCLPETKNKTLQEIEDSFYVKSDKNDDTSE